MSYTALADHQSDYMQFIDFTARFGKSYASKDLHDDKFEVFQQNLRFIENHNAKEEMSFKMGINQFSDLTEQEFLDMYAIEKEVKQPPSEHML